MTARPRSSLINPLDLIARKQVVGPEDTAKIELPVLRHFDAARRGQINNAGYNFISRHLVMANYLAKRLRSRSFITISDCAGNLWGKAGARPGATVSLTTKEYSAIRACLGVYFRHLPYTEIGMYQEACQVAELVMANTK